MAAMSEDFVLVDRPVYAGSSASPQGSGVDLEPSERKQAALESLWRGKAVLMGAAESRKALKKTIRKGVLSSRRREVWLAVSGATEFMAGSPRHFETVFQAHFEQRLPPVDVPIPTLGGVDYGNPGTRTPDVPLNAERIVMWRKVMLVFAAEHPEVRFCPMLADLAAVCLLYMDEKECFVVLERLLLASRPHLDRQYLLVGDESLTVFSRTFTDLIRIRLPRVYKRMQRLSMDALCLAGPWFSRFFVGSLPLHVALRVIDVLMSEGLKVIFRVGLAILRVGASDLQAAPDAATVVTTIRQMARNYDDPDGLLKTAFAIYLSRKHAAKFDAVNAGKGAVDLTQLDIEDHGGHSAFHRPSRDLPSAFLSDDDFDVLWSWLGESLLVKDAQRVFSTKDDGYNLGTLLERSKEVAPSLLVIKTVEEQRGYVFGALVTHPWKITKGFFGSGESFVFTLRPRVSVFPWSHENDYFQACAPKRIAVGAGALVLDEDLQHGHSEPCSTFGTATPLGGAAVRLHVTPVAMWQ